MIAAAYATQSEPPYIDLRPKSLTTNIALSTWNDDDCTDEEPIHTHTGWAPISHALA